MKRRNEQTIGEVLSHYLKASQLENRIFEDKIAAIWHETLGDEITAQTARIYLQGGTLTVELRSPSLRTEILMRRTFIAQQLNNRLGAEVVRQVIVR